MSEHAPRRLESLRGGLCLACNYELQGLPVSRCPECGREFDWADPSSFNPGRPIPRYAAWAAGPISWPVSGVTLAGVAITLWRARLPGISFAAGSPQMLGWALLAVGWLCWPLLRRAVLRHYGWPAGVIRPMSRRYAVVPIFVLAMVAVTSRQLPRQWAFAASKPDFDHLATEVLQAPKVKHDNRRVGVFFAKQIQAVPRGGMKFTVEDDDVHFIAGFEYLPGLDPKNVAWHSSRYVGGGWWAWRQDG